MLRPINNGIVSLKVVITIIAAQVRNYLRLLATLCNRLWKV
jgi:hypothetical protein